MMRINADVGECGLDIDAQIIPRIDMANIACGGHIGDEKSMQQTIKLAKKSQTLIGAHPSYVDKINFGRLSPNKLDKNLLRQQIQAQINQLNQLCLNQGVVLSYVKPHGALYYDIVKNLALFEMMLKIMQDFKQSLFLVLQAKKASNPMLKLAQNYGIHLVDEFFADRAYHGIELVPRTQKNSLLTDPKQIVEQFITLSKRAASKSNTICFHSDNPASIQALSNTIFKK